MKGEASLGDWEGWFSDEFKLVLGFVEGLQKVTASSVRLPL